MNRLLKEIGEELIAADARLRYYGRIATANGFLHRGLTATIAFLSSSALGAYLLPGGFLENLAPILSLACAAISSALLVFKFDEREKSAAELFRGNSALVTKLKRVERTAAKEDAPADALEDDFLVLREEISGLGETGVLLGRLRESLWKECWAAAKQVHNKQ